MSTSDKDPPLDRAPQRQQCPRRLAGKLGTSKLGRRIQEVKYELSRRFLYVIKRFNLKSFTLHFCINHSFIGDFCQTCCHIISRMHRFQPAILAPLDSPHSDGCDPPPPIGPILTSFREKWPRRFFMLFCWIIITFYLIHAETHQRQSLGDWGLSHENPGLFAETSHDRGPVAHRLPAAC